jgi:hypothetical protein
MIGLRKEAEGQRSTQGSIELLAAPGVGKRYKVKDLLISGNISATGVVVAGSTTKTIGKYIPTYGHKSFHFSGDGYTLGDNEALTITTSVADFLVNAVVVAYEVG